MADLYEQMAKEEKWEIVADEAGKKKVLANNRLFNIGHPYEIHLNLYRDAVDPAEKFHSMMRLHHMLWPQHVPTWNYWTERRFQAHCEGYKIVTMAAGASAGKSMDSAKMAFIFWLSDPKHNGCIIASTTLESMEARIWGYLMKLIGNCALPVDARILRSKPPKVVYTGQNDRIHGIFATAIKTGEEERVLATIIGRHPDKRLMMILDEADSMNSAVTSSIANLEEGVEFFQLWAIANSNSRNDLHGALSTPKNGWDSVDPNKDDVWPTNYKNSICLYFNPYKSPAIVEQDPVRRMLLSKFLITAEKIAEKKKIYGEGSDLYYRFVLGFWKSDSSGEVILTEKFLTENDVEKFAEWSGFYPLYVLAGLDPAFQSGGEGCKMRLGLLGQTVDGRMAMDFMKEKLMFRLDVMAVHQYSGERQIAEQVAKICKEYSCPLSNLALDATGVGRSLGEVIKLVMGVPDEPYRIVSVRPTLQNQQNQTNPFVQVFSASDLWMRFKTFVLQGQIRGIDEITRLQIINRLVITKNGRLVLEPKEDFKKRMQAINPALAHSPDEADTMMLCCIAAVLRYGFMPAQRKDLPPPPQDPMWVKKIVAYNNEKQMQSRAEAQSNYSSGGRPNLVCNFSSPIEHLPSSSERVRNRS